MVLSFNLLTLTSFFLSQALANTGRYDFFPSFFFLSPEGGRGPRSGPWSSSCGDAAAAAVAAAGGQTRPGSEIGRAHV